MIKVWDPVVRILHWSLVTGFTAAYFTQEARGPWHEWLGYFVLGIVVIRLLLGFAGSHYARFLQFVRSPADTLNYARSFIRPPRVRYIGHNPLGGWMILALLFSTTLTCVSGWLYTTDRFWGVEWVEDIHELFTWVTIAMVVLHVSGVIIGSLHDKENLVTSMVHGKKRAPSETDVV